MKNSEDSWQAEDDHRTLSRATEIQGDRKRMSGVKKQHRKMQKTLNKVGQSFGGSR